MKSYIVMDVLVPAIKKAISDIVTNGIDMILYGEAGKSKKNSTASKVSYQKFYDGGKKDYTASKVERVTNMMNSYLKLAEMPSQY